MRHLGINHLIRSQKDLMCGINIDYRPQADTKKLLGLEQVLIIQRSSLGKGLG